MNHADLPSWIKAMTRSDLNFIRKFVLASGSLKTLAQDYGVSYPTIRARLNKLIETVAQADSEMVDPFHARLRELVASGELEPKAARQLLSLHHEAIPSDHRKEIAHG